MKKTFCLLAIALVLATGCSRVAVPFIKVKPDYTQVPEAELRRIAREIEGAVAQGNRTPDIQNGDVIVVDTPLIRQAIRERAARRELLDHFLVTGHAWERRDGLIYMRHSKDYKKSTTRRQRDRHAQLVMSENDNRWSIYEGIVGSSNLPPAALGAVREVFSQERTQYLDPGVLFEGPEGEAETTGARQ